MNESEVILQHRKDAEKVSSDLDTMKPNIKYGQHTWSEVVRVRKNHINSFLESLNKREKEFEHFK